MAALHDRMPVILDKADWPKWLGEEPAADDELLAMLRPSPDQMLRVWPVDKKVGERPQQRRGIGIADLAFGIRMSKT